MPTKPNSSFSGLTLIILYSFDVILRASQVLFFKAFTISLLNSIKTFSTISIVLLSVTLKPLIKLVLIFNSLSLLLILFPPPWTMIGESPSFFKTEISPH